MTQQNTPNLDQSILGDFIMINQKPKQPEQKQKQPEQESKQPEQESKQLKQESKHPENDKNKGIDIFSKFVNKVLLSDVNIFNKKENDKDKWLDVFSWNPFIGSLLLEMKLILVIQETAPDNSIYFINKIIDFIRQDNSVGEKYTIVKVFIPGSFVVKKKKPPDK